MKLEPGDEDGKKLYKNRYFLFSKYDEGIRLKGESWYATTPECVAQHIAERVSAKFGKGSSNVVDGFAGVGGNVIQFALQSGFCAGNDLDLEKLEFLDTNLKVYGVHDRAQKIDKDILKLTPEEVLIPASRDQKIHTFYMSPPWGGADYFFLPEYKLENVSPDIQPLLTKAFEFSRNVIMTIPENTSITDSLEHYSKIAS